MIKIEQGSYCLLEFKDISDFDDNHNDILYWICMMDDPLQTQTLLSKVAISHASFKLTGDALDWWEQLQELRIWQG